VDGTHNKAGTIDQTIHLYTKLGETEQHLQFFVTDLGKDQMILGYPWLQTFNPDINWTNGELKKQLSVQTMVSKAQEAKHKALRLCRIAMEDATPEITNLQELQAHINNVMQSEEIHTSELGEQLHKTTIAQQMAEKAYNPTKVNTEATIPDEYLWHKKVFLEKEAACFPPPRPWDHKIKLTTDTPETINGKIYPIPQWLTQELDKWTDNMLERGFISISSSNYGSPTFTVTKKDGTQQIVQDFRELNKHMVKDMTPLPDIKQAIEGLGDKVLFTKFDICKGYNNIQIVPEDCWKTGFKTH
jgi:hypothetical protein